jgi:uncharacterized protein
MLLLIPQIQTAWVKQRQQIEDTGTKLLQELQNTEKTQTRQTPTKQVIVDCFNQISLVFDNEYGGFGQAPKFPSPHNLIFLLRYWNQTKDENAKLMVEKTLTAMRLGGIFDQLGYGFHRYSTDQQWLVPHFEKTLYDQAMITLAYLEAYQAWGKTEFKQTAKETLDYVLRVLTSLEGGFYSAEDADSEGEEGKFYVWTQGQMKQVLNPQDAFLATKFFGTVSEGNYNEAGATSKTGKNILHLAGSFEDLAAQSKLTVEDVTIILERTTQRLFEKREKRIHPLKDDKILVDWNGLMIAALAVAGRVLGEQKYLLAAAKAADFILEKMQDKNGLLYHRYAKGERAFEGFLDDYAYLVFGLTELYMACFEEKYLQAAVKLTDVMVEQFWDKQAAGLFFTAKNSEALPRIKQTYDGAIPSGNSIAMYDLLRLSKLADKPNYETLASAAFEGFSEKLETNPFAHTFMLTALSYALNASFAVVLVGEKNNQDTSQMLQTLNSNYLPTTTIKLTAEKAEYKKIDNKATAYVCKGQTCTPATVEPKKMLANLTS